MWCIDVRVMDDVIVSVGAVNCSIITPTDFIFYIRADHCVSYPSFLYLWCKGRRRRRRWRRRKWRRG
jgi:hypothetical protein